MTKLTLPPALPCSIKDKRKEINGGVGWDRLRKGKEQDVHLSSFCLWLYLYTLDTRRTGRPNFTFNTLKKKHIKNQINKHQLCIVPMVEVWWINSPRYAQWLREDTEMHRLHKHLLRWFRKVFFSKWRALTLGPFGPLVPLDPSSPISPWTKEYTFRADNKKSFWSYINKIRAIFCARESPLKRICFSNNRLLM